MNRKAAVSVCSVKNKHRLHFPLCSVAATVLCLLCWKGLWVNKLGFWGQCFFCFVLILFCFVRLLLQKPSYVPLKFWMIIWWLRLNMILSSFFLCIILCTLSVEPMRASVEFRKRFVHIVMDFLRRTDKQQHVSNQMKRHLAKKSHVL